MSEKKELNKKEEEQDLLKTMKDQELKVARDDRDKARRDVHKAIVAGRGLADRVEMLERVMLKPMEKKWKHPFYGLVSGRYHKCARCGGNIGDEVVLVTERLRSGDKMTVFCGVYCLSMYNKW